VLLLVGCIDLSWQPPDPGTVMAELTNPEKSFSARVIATKVKGTYIFEVRSIIKDSVLAKKTISAPIGYHGHSVSLIWSNDGQTVTAIIDHDFGEGNKVINLNILDKGVSHFSSPDRLFACTPNLQVRKSLCIYM
jgi:hypothetical protein